MWYHWWTPASGGPEEVTVADCLFEKRSDGVGLITLNRPESLNAMGGELMPLLAEHLEACEGDAGIRCVALTGAGRGFCAGGDVRGQAARAQAREEGAEPRGRAPEPRAGRTPLQQSQLATSFRLHTMPKPTVALVNGPAAGAGLSLALACDIRFCSDRASFHTAFAKVGLSGDYGGSYYLQRLIGYGRALELYYTGERVDAQRALELGIANHVVPHDELSKRGLELCARLAAGPTRTYALMKSNFNLAETARLDEFLDREADNMGRSALTRDHREGAKAFVQRRAPEFKGE